MTDEQPSSQACCYIKELPEQAQESSARSAVQIYLPNAPVLQFAQASIWSVPGALGVYNKKYWGPKPLILTVSFLESPPADLCAKILDNMNAWKCSIKFTQVIFFPAQIHCLVHVM